MVETHTKKRQDKKEKCVHFEKCQQLIVSILNRSTQFTWTGNSNSHNVTWNIPLSDWKQEKHDEPWLPDFLGPHHCSK